jgi:hypothetical protein
MLLGNGSINMFPRQRGIFEGIIFYAVHVTSEESRRLVLPRTSCCPRNFDVMVGLAWSYDPESYAGGSITTGRDPHAGQVMIQTKRDTLVLQVGGVGSGVDNPTH